MKFYRDGKPYYVSTGTTDKTEARRRLKLVEGEVASGQFKGVLVNKTRFEDLVQGIRDDYTVNERKSSRRLNDYIQHLAGHFSAMRANGITTDRINAYIKKRRDDGAANGTINRELACLKRMFNLAAKQTPPKVSQVPHIPMLEEHNVRSGFFTHEEYLAVRGALPDYAQVAITIAYYTGMRIGEILGLKWSQVNLVEGRIFLSPLDTKNETPRVVYMTPDLYQVLSEAKRRQEAAHAHGVWVCQRKGNRVSDIKKSWLAACKRVGLEGRLVHDFRRTAVRNMTRAGIPEKVAMAISGHKTRSVFDRYNIVNEADLKDAASKLTDFYNKEKVTLTVTLEALQEPQCRPPLAQAIEIEEYVMEPAIGIEPTTCGLRILTSQSEPTQQEPTEPKNEDLEKD